MAESAASGSLSISLGSGLCCRHFVEGVRVPAERGAPVTRARRRLTPKYRRDGVRPVPDMGSTIAFMAGD